ncbi:hypothetical protein LEP1GSC191_0836 [Leptospira borgpetersenii serovar Mini str. 201000851]|uniref:Uncharacterized protein n=1 Tax=Leptospira borgpetersenii str. 200801926 TaxID=1193009 RepID=A0ABN0HUJ0_LEPBO|nr:hypothetical protein LEP1GSC128_4089 [Leptospira borgpetersenii str. 200801926]EMK14323.1 hypothetical protein LEP1GSC066_2670 [Leptospira sp. serovar Kenya str. Sh9]ENO64627.1 hypothetical protein LEP1GSC191_0836 [Leptospira borgpetersenii serovar Mini str. 201000851]
MLLEQMKMVPKMNEQFLQRYRNPHRKKRYFKKILYPNKKK